MLGFFPKHFTVKSLDCGSFLVIGPIRLGGLNMKTRLKLLTAMLVFSYCAYRVLAASWSGPSHATLEASTQNNQQATGTFSLVQGAHCATTQGSNTCRHNCFPSSGSWESRRVHVQRALVGVLCL